MTNMNNIKTDENGNIIYYVEDNGATISMEYDDKGNIIKSIKNYEIETRFYYNNDKIVYAEIYDYDTNELYRKVWIYYRNNYINHIVSDDGIDVWLDKKGNETDPQL